jgi:hypothetical protein
VKGKDQEGAGQNLENLTKTQAPDEIIAGALATPEEMKASGGTGGAAILGKIAEIVGGYSRVGNAPAKVINEVSKNESKKGNSIIIKIPRIPRKGR